MQVSKLHLHSYGIVAANKERSSMEIEVTPIEDTPMVDGELTDAATIEKAKGKDANGASFEAQVVTSASIKARWLPFGSNRATSPDVRRGEKVAIYRFGDADIYYWTSLEYDAKLRKLETVIYTFSNTRVEAEESSPSTCYFIEVSTHDKVIQIHTSKSDGEPYEYDIVLNTKDGNFIIKDDIDNIITLNSPEHQIAMQNTDGSYFEIIKRDINMTAIDDINITAGRHLNVKVGGNETRYTAGTRDTTIDGMVNNTFGASLNTNVAAAINYKAPGKMTVDAPDLVSTAMVTSGSSVNVGTSLNTGAGGGGGGDCIIRGAIRVEGSVSINGYLTSSSGASFAGSVSAPNI